MPNWLRSLESHVSVGPIQCVSDMLRRCETLMLQGKVHFVLSHAHPDVNGHLQPADYPPIQLGTDTLLPVSSPDHNGHACHTVDSSSCTIQLLAYGAESGISRILRPVLGVHLDSRPVQTIFHPPLASA